MVAGQAGRTRVSTDLIRQLASAYASYRLFPGDLEQPGFQAAVERVRGAATAALTAGTFHADIRSGRFVTEQGEISHDETIDRLAMACYERRLEHLHVRAIPDARDLAAFGEVLTTGVEELDEHGGAGAALTARGVSSIVVGAVTPEGVDDDLVDLSNLTPEQFAMWEKLQDPGALAASLLADGLADNTPGVGRDLFERFQSLHAELPEELTARRDFFVRIRRVLSDLPGDVQREFMATVISRISDDQFASDMGVNLTDGELADLLIELARHGGPDPVELGKRIVAMTDRKGEVLEIVAHRMDDTPEPRELLKGLRPTMLALSKQEDETQVRQVVADALAEGLVQASSTDATYVRELYPETDADSLTLALMALRDYLAAEDSRVSLDRVLDVWASSVRTAAREGDMTLLDRLLGVVEGVRHDEDDVFKRDAVSRAIETIPTPELVHDLLTSTQDQTALSEARRLLDRFGSASLGAVLDLLAVEEDRSLRSQLVATAAELAHHDLGAMAERVEDPRWYVVRNLVTILGRGAGPEAVPLLVKLLPHPDPSVRKEVLRSLVACGGTEAVPHIRRLATDSDESVRTAALSSLSGLTADVAARALADVTRHATHLDERRRALEALASHPSAEVPELLAGLASRRERPKLPRALRRQAKKLARAADRRTS